MSLRIADIRVEWPRIKDAVTELCKDGPERAEDVYAACVYGKATLLTCEDGFIVCRIEQCAYTTRQIMFIWKASATIYGAVDKWQAEVDRIAKEQGATMLQMASTRSGWKRVDGWSELTTIYARTLE